jgi:hypothetical protein
LTTLEDGSVGIHEGGVAERANSAAPNDGIDSAAGASRAPAFTASEHARILHVLIDARMTSARRLLSRPRERDELDREPINPWDDHICPLFNDRSFAPACNELLCDGITASDVAGIEPLRVEHERTSSQLADKWAKLRSEYTKCVERYQRSGQPEGDVFPRFTRGNRVVMYLHALANTPAGPALCDMATRLSFGEAREEVGIVATSASRSTALERRQSRKRGRDSMQQQSEVRVRG